MPCYDCRAPQKPEVMVFCRCTYAQCRNCWDKMCLPLRFSGRSPVCHGCQSDWQWHRLITYLQDHHQNQAAPPPEPVEQDSSSTEDEDSESENFLDVEVPSFLPRAAVSGPPSTRNAPPPSPAPAPAPVSAPPPPPVPAAAPLPAPFCPEEAHRILRRIGAGSVIRQNKRPGQDEGSESVEGRRKRPRGVTAGEVRCPRRRLGNGVILEQRSDGLWEEVEACEDELDESEQSV